MSAPEQKLAIIGAGLIGGSIAKAALTKHVAKNITLCDSNEISLAHAKNNKLARHVTTDPAEAVRGATMVILATPTGALEDIMPLIASELAENTILMDVCSVKRRAMELIEPHLPAHVYYIPAHPIAGSERGGIVSSDEHLFEGRRVILTPAHPNITPEYTEASEFWQELGAQVEAMPAHIHDKVYAYVSHLPHALAFAAANILAPLLLDEEQNENVERFMRLSHSNLDLWMDIFVQNQDNVIHAIDRYLDAIWHIIGELQTPPEDAQIDTQAEKNSQHVQQTVFPAIAAACLITTIMEAEKQNGFPFSRYAGLGFIDFISPATNSPEEAMEYASHDYEQVRDLLTGYAKQIEHFRKVISDSVIGENA